jgi:hypothetical protein
MDDVSPNIQTAIDNAIQTALPSAVDNAIQNALPPALEAVLPTAINDALDDALTPENIIKKISVGDMLQKILHYIGDNKYFMEAVNTIIGAVTTVTDPSKLMALGDTLVNDLTPEKLRALFDESSELINSALSTVGREDLADGILNNRGFFANLALEVLLPSNHTVYNVALYASSILLVLELYLLYSYDKIKTDIGTGAILSPVASAQTTAFFVLLIATGINTVMLFYLLRLKENYDREILTYFWHFNLLLTLCVFTFNSKLSSAITTITDNQNLSAQVNNPSLLSSLKSSASINSIVVLVFIGVTVLAWLLIGALDFFLLIIRQLIHTFLF